MHRYKYFDSVIHEDIQYIKYTTAEMLDIDEDDVDIDFDINDRIDIGYEWAIVDITVSVLGFSKKYRQKYYAEPGKTSEIFAEPVHEIISDFVRNYEDSENVTASTYVAGADSPDEFEEGEFDGLDNTLDDIADGLDEIQDAMEDIDEDDVSIDMNNNISNHYIAECERCHGIFISAVTESDQEVTSITGICPLCEEDTEQELKWIIKSVNADE